MTAINPTPNGCVASSTVDYEAADTSSNYRYLNANSDDDVEFFAKKIHDAGRTFVQAGLTFVHQDLKVPMPPVFVEWENMSENARIGRRMQAKELLEACEIKCLIS